MLLKVLIDCLDEGDISKVINKEKFIYSQEDEKWKLRLLGENNCFFHSLLAEKKLKLKLEVKCYCKMPINILKIELNR